MKITAGIFILASHTYASDSVEISGVKFPASYTHENRNLTLRGYAVLNYMYIIKAYAGAFYLEEGKSIRGQSPVSVHINTVSVIVNTYIPLQICLSL